MFKNFIRNLKLGVDKPPTMWYNNDSEREVIKMKKEQIVLVEQRDRNGKLHYIAVANMELAKKLYSSAPKRQLTLIKGE